MKEDDSKATDDTQQDVGGALIDSLLNPAVPAQAGALFDVAFSKMTTVAVFSEIPVLDIASRVYGIVSSIRNDLFLKKIVGFLSGCTARGEAEKSEFEKQLKTDAALRTRVGESLLLILERADHLEKTAILGKVFAGRLREEIDDDLFYRLSTAINNASISALKTLDSSYDKIATYDMKAGKPFADTLDDATSHSLYNLGFMRADGYMEMTFLPNELGSTLIRLMKR
jgi:hypothetical protein